MEGIDLSYFEDLVKEVESIGFDALDNLKGKEEQWLDLRKGKFTASEFVRLMGYEDKTSLPDGALTYIKECALELLTNDIREKRYSSSKLDWGHEWEAEAAEEFMKETGIEVVRYGRQQEFIVKGEDVGATPDGIIEQSNIVVGGIETKCPDAKTHLEYMETLTISNFKEKLKKYYWQIQGCMYVTGANYWYFISFDPTFKNPEKRLFYLKIERNDDDIRKLRTRLSMGIKLKNQIVEKYS